MSKVKQFICICKTKKNLRTPSRLLFGTVVYASSPKEAHEEFEQQLQGDVPEYSKKPENFVVSISNTVKGNKHHVGRNLKI